MGASTMPFYEYTCEKCGKATDARRSMAEADAPIACEHCGSKNTRRAISTFLARNGSATGESSLPISPCGRCGDPRGSCGA